MIYDEARASFNCVCAEILESKELQIRKQEPLVIQPPPVKTTINILVFSIILNKSGLTSSDMFQLRKNKL